MENPDVPRRNNKNLQNHQLTLVKNKGLFVSLNVALRFSWEGGPPQTLTAIKGSPAATYCQTSPPSSFILPTASKFHLESTGIHPGYTGFLAPAPSVQPVKSPWAARHDSAGLQAPSLAALRSRRAPVPGRSSKEQAWPPTEGGSSPLLSCRHSGGSKAAGLCLCFQGSYFYDASRPRCRRRVTVSF